MKPLQVGFKYNGKYLLGFEVRVKSQGDVYLFVFERGHRREHVSYHKDGQVDYNADRKCQSKHTVDILNPQRRSGRITAVSPLSGFSQEDGFQYHRIS